MAETAVAPVTPVTPSVTPDAGGGNPVIDRITDKSMQPAEINLDSKVTVGGKTYSVKDLISAKEEAATASEKAAKADALRGHIKTVYANPDAEPAAQKAALIELLVDQGIARDQAVKDADEAFGKDETPASPQQLTREQRVFREKLDLDIADAATNSLGAGDLKAIVDGIIKRDGDAAGKATADFLGQQVLQSLRNALAERTKREGDFKYAWIRELLPEAAKSVAGNARRFTGDPRNLGKSSADLAGEDPLRALLGSKPVPAPQWKPGSSSDIQKESSDYIADALSRALAPVGAAV